MKAGQPRARRDLLALGASAGGVEVAHHLHARLPQECPWEHGHRPGADVLVGLAPGPRARNEWHTEREPVA